VVRGDCKVTYHVLGERGGQFAAAVAVTNTGHKAINGWSLTWAFPTAQRLGAALNAAVRQEGPIVTAGNEFWNRRIEPGRTVAFAVTAASPLANASPELFRLNGAVCT
jgi:endoglucanase